MMHRTSRGKVFDYVGIGMGFAAMLIATGATFGGALGSRNDGAGEAKGRFHKITYPAVTRNSDSDCDEEIAGYATALVNLQAAQDVADQAYVEWYVCEYGSDPGDPGEPDPPGDPEPEHSLASNPAAALPSVLER
ncbi:MAG: hypothetical protein KDA45_00350 [Planctomycetales bacterium]|nr:hypothetical protein [Planctomycetales bacterium]